eukprot:SAG22_NODE_73_length_22318_cov_47.105315_22_plen_87_part_00
MDFFSTVSPVDLELDVVAARAVADADGALDVEDVAAADEELELAGQAGVDLGHTADRRACTGEGKARRGKTYETETERERERERTG